LSKDRLITIGFETDNINGKRRGKLPVWPTIGKTLTIAAKLRGSAIQVLQFGIAFFCHHFGTPYASLQM
jgi:hypothetical protein